MKHAMLLYYPIRKSVSTQLLVTHNIGSTTELWNTPTEHEHALNTLSLRVSKEVKRCMS